MAGSNARLLAVAQLVSLVTMALALVPAGAHFFELPNKMQLPAERYMVVQGIYSGWALFGVAIFAALAATLAHTLMVRADRAAFLLSLAALACLVATQVIFWSFTYPMNVASTNWTTLPSDFEAARRQWEYSHAVNAGLTFAGFLAICLSVLVYDKRHAAVALKAAE
jgi:hypothetical protein